MVDIDTLKMQVKLMISGRKLRDMDAFSKSDPQCLIHEKKNGVWTEIAKTEVINNQLNPDFTTHVVVDYFFEKVQHLKFTMIDVDDGRNFDLIGEVEVTMGKLMGAARQTWNSSLKKGDKEHGKLIVRTQALEASDPQPSAQAQVQQPQGPGFVNYLRAGWQIGMTVAIDYTASNGNPSDPESLHYIGPQNQYEKALMSVGMVIEPYDHDKLFPVFGFGGIPRHMGINGINHCFAMNGNAANPAILSVEAIVATYKSTLPQIGLGGPTLFGPLLQEFLNFVVSQQGQNQYHVMLLLTDGVIHDMPRTKDLICQLAELPVSVIICGVGQADFSAMVELDGDDGGLRNSNGQPCSRDIVQFVEYNKAVAHGELAEQVLKEVPNQVCSYMQKMNVQCAPLDQPV